MILYESGGHYHTDLSTSASIMLGVGIFPVVFAMVGWVYILSALRPSFYREEPRADLQAALTSIQLRSDDA